MIREGGIASESLLGGLTSLRKANYAQVSLYNHAFFGITIGLERMCKLAILLASRTVAGGTYPSDDEFRSKYGHDLQTLFQVVTDIHDGLVPDVKYGLPNREVTALALSVLSDFARWTRYYNLDLLVGAKKVHLRRDPVEAWFTDVGGWILRNKYPRGRAAKDEELARDAEKLIGSASMVLHSAEDGTPISTIYEATLQSRRFEIIQREGTLICACLARYVADVIWVLTWRARAAGADDVPDLAEFFAILYNDDAYLRGRKNFSVIR